MGRSFENRKHAIFKTAALKSKLYSRYGKHIYVIAKNGVADPDANPALRAVIDRAKKDQVPAHVIDKAIQKAKGAGGENFAPARYEGYGPGGCQVIVDCLTDNPQRTIAEIRNAFTKSSSKLGATGSVAPWFDERAVLAFKGDNSDEVLEALLEADVNVEDVESKDGAITVFAPASELFKAKNAILAKYVGLEFDTQEITLLPQSTKALGPDDVPHFDKLMNMLNECDDVQEVYHNAELPAS